MNANRLMPAADAFFLHVETANAPQHVGGLAVLAPAAAGQPTVAEVRDLLRAEIANIPRFRQHPQRRSRWRRWRWRDVDPADIDFDWHVTERMVAGFDRAVAELAAEPLPSDRPMWRIIVARDIVTGRSAVVFLVHHCVADGLGTVAHALQILRPRLDLPATPTNDRIGKCRAAFGTVAGIAHLARDGKPAAKLPPGSPRRQFATCFLDIDTVRAIAHERGARVTDVLLSLLAIAMRRTHPAFAAAVDHKLRVSVPVMVAPHATKRAGNATAAVMMDLPLTAMPAADLLAHIGNQSSRLLTPARFMGARFVMSTVAGALPAPWQRWFARSVYGPGFLQAIVTNMAGPPVEMSIAGIALQEVTPILPLAPGAPLALGALSWAGRLGIGLAADPQYLDASALATAMTVALRAFTGPPPKKGCHHGDTAEALNAETLFDIAAQHDHQRPISASSTNPDRLGRHG